MKFIVAITTAACTFSLNMAEARLPVSDPMVPDFAASAIAATSAPAMVRFADASKQRIRRRKTRTTGGTSGSGTTSAVKLPSAPPVTGWNFLNGWPVKSNQDPKGATDKQGITSNMDAWE